GAKNQPKNSILTLSSDPSEGVLITGGGSGNASVAGGVFSNTRIQVSAGTLTIDKGNLTTKSTSVPDVADCNSNKIVLTGLGVRRCGYTLPDPSGDDPLYAPSLTNAPTNDQSTATATCDKPKGVLTYHPGRYTSPPQLPTGKKTPCAD